MRNSLRQSCHVCGEPSTRVYRGYPLCHHCDTLLDELLAMVDSQTEPVILLAGSHIQPERKRNAAHNHCNER